MRQLAPRQAARNIATRQKARNIAPRNCLAFSFADIVRDFLAETGKRLVECANSTSVRPPPAPKAHREERNVRKWQLDAYCPRTNCGGRVYREVVLGLSKAYGATSGGLGGREPPERPFLPYLFPRGKR